MANTTAALKHFQVQRVELEAEKAWTPDSPALPRFTPNLAHNLARKAEPRYAPRIFAILLSEGYVNP